MSRSPDPKFTYDSARVIASLNSQPLVKHELRIAKCALAYILLALMGISG
ncbi:MAG: hypothetical protein F6K26_49660 [Moorea sp. SIO2I5]|nr:hypothetical protein [Moorena sp. SIO2I5]